MTHLEEILKKHMEANVKALQQFADVKFDFEEFKTSEMFKSVMSAMQEVETPTDEAKLLLQQFSKKLDEVEAREAQAQPQPAPPVFSLLQKLEQYGFASEGGPLTLCSDWHELKAAIVQQSKKAWIAGFDTGHGWEPKDGNELKPTLTAYLQSLTKRKEP